MSRFNIMNHLKTIVYDETNMRLFDMYVTEINGGANIPPTLELMGTLSDEPIELDPTTMKRIAEYNKKKELKILNEEIKDAEMEKKQLQREIKILQAKLEKCNKFIDDTFDGFYDDEED